MADDIRLSTALPQHPKVVRLLHRLHEQGAWSLVCLFSWTGNNRPNGDLFGLSCEDIEIAASWNGECGAFVDALVELRFLDGEPGKYVVHDWREHQPWVATRADRTAKARTAAKKRWKEVDAAHRSMAAQNAARARWKSAGASRMRAKARIDASHVGQDACPPPNPTLPNSTRKPSLSKLEADPRHVLLRTHIQTCWLKKNPGAPAAPWSGKAAKRLKELLDNNPAWEIDALKQCVDHRFASDANHSESPEKWLGDILNYSGGPLNKFHQPKGENHGGEGRADTRRSDYERQHGNLAARNRARAAVEREHPTVTTLAH